MIEDPNSRAGNLKDNPIHEDMLEAAKMCGTDYCVNLVMNQKQEIAGIFQENCRDHMKQQQIF